MRLPSSGLKRDNPAFPLLMAGVSFWGVTDNNGAGTGLTIRCGALVLEPPYDNHKLKVLTGPSAGQCRDITLHPAGTDTLTVSAAFTNVTGAPQIINAGTLFVVMSDTPSTAEVAALVALVRAVEHETEWAAGSSVEQVANAAAVNLTTISVTPTFPVGSTRVRAILIASIHATNPGQAANTHHIDLKVAGQRAAGGWVDQLNLTAQDTLGLVGVEGSSDGWCGAIDVTALVNTSAVQYDFRFVVDSDNAGAVNYTQNFTLVLIYTI